MTTCLRDRLIDHITHLHVPQAKPVNGVINICAEDMADALLPFILEEIATADTGTAPQGPQHQVAEFHRAFGVVIDQQLTPDLIALRRRLISEEVREVGEALENGSLAEIAQELADLAYVTYGTAVSLGIDLDAAVTEVHRANMSKLGADGKPIHRSDGKVLKGPNYTPPDMTAALPSSPGGPGIL